jgi:hypothetical protein
MKDFEAQILEDAAKNSELWWGEPMSKDILKHMMFPTLKYSKDPKTKKIDYTKSPSLSAKVVNYNDNWKVEIYDTKYNRLYPCDNPDVTPMDLVVKLSKVNCILECGGIWIGGKAWGITWKLVECVVKPREVYKSTGRCRIKVDESKFEEPLQEEIVVPPPSLMKPKSKPVVQDTTIVEDSDNEEPEPEKVVTQLVSETETVSEQIQQKNTEIPVDLETVKIVENEEGEGEEDPDPVIVKKKIVKKIAEDDESVAVPTSSLETRSTTAKKVVKKVVAKK